MVIIKELTLLSNFDPTAYKVDARNNKSLGRGTLGNVYLGELVNQEDENGLPKTVAVKKSEVRGTGYEETEMTFCEFGITKFDHVNLVKIYHLEIEKEGPRKFANIFMELCDNTLEVAIRGVEITK